MRRVTTFATSLLVAALAAADVPQLKLEPADDGIERGTFTVWENREAKAGRTLDLDVIVLRARSDDPRPDPVFVFDGGPGLNVTARWRDIAQSWWRDDRDVVLVDQRGTGGNHRLDCDAPGSPDDFQGYLDQVFDDPAAFRDCLDELATRADLRWYGTATAMRDVDDLRRALGYDKINLTGGSYGSRAVFEYVRRHGGHVRTATVTGVAPVAFINPLYHAWAAQQALDLILEECAADPECAAAYEDLTAKLDAVLARLDESPAHIEMSGPQGESAELLLTRDAFAEALRLMMYYDSRRIPYLIETAFAGDYGTYVGAAIQSNRAVRDAIAFGMLLCVTCGEDIPRIPLDEIDDLTDDTFLGEVRVRQQMAVCALWPKSRVPDDHGEALRSDVPVLMLSGKYDPVTPPRFAEEAARHLPNALHVVAPGSHGLWSNCIEDIKRVFMDRASIEGLDTSCVESMSAGEFYVEETAD